MKNNYNKLKSWTYHYIRQHLSELVLVLFSVLFMLSYLNFGFVGIDFGHTHDEHRILGSIIETAKTKVFLPTWYNYPSLTYLIALLVSFINVIMNVFVEVGIPTNPDQINELKLSVLKFAKTNHVNVHFVIRKVFFVISFLGSLSLYFTVRLLGAQKRYALIAVLFSLCSFQLFYHSRWIAPDQLLYATNAFWLTAILYYFKSKKVFHLFIAAIICGLVLSAKYQGGILLFALIFVAFRNKLSLRNFCILLSLYVLTFMIITPACFVEPVSFISDVLYEIKHYTINNHGLHKVESGYSHGIKLLDYIALKSSSSHPLLSIVVFLLSCVGAYYLYKENKNVFVVLVVIPTLYFLYFSTQSMMIVRNYLFIFPYVFILSAFALDRLSKTISKKYIAIFSTLFLVINVSYSYVHYKTTSHSVHSNNSEWKQNVDSFMMEHPGSIIAFSKGTKAYVSKDRFLEIDDNQAKIDFLVCDIQEFLQLSRKYIGNDSIPKVELLGQYRGMYEVIAGPNEMDINHYPNWPGKSRLLAIESTGANMIWFYFQNDSSLVLTNN